MDKQKAWEIFASTGRIEDYLIYKNTTGAEIAPENSTDKNNGINKNKNRRTDNKTTEYW